MDEWQLCYSYAPCDPRNGEDFVGFVRAYPANGMQLVYELTATGIVVYGRGPPKDLERFEEDAQDATMRIFLAERSSRN